MRLFSLSSMVVMLACSEHGLNNTDKPVNTEEDTGSEEVTGNVSTEPQACANETIPAEELPASDVCPIVPEGGFTPIVEWDYGAGEGCLSLPTVGDIDKDGSTDIVLNLIDPFAVITGGTGDLVVLHGDGSGEKFRKTDAKLAYGSPLALGDINSDGIVEIVGVREYSSAMFFTAGDYTVVAWDGEGNELWESEHFINTDFSWASAPVLADMNGDGQSEIVVGHVILNSDGTTRGVGEFGIGSYGIVPFGDVSLVESAVPAVTDLNLDGEFEIIVGNAWYDIDGNAVFSNPLLPDGMIAVANLDDDPEGEYVATTNNTLRAFDSNGASMWGPIVYPAPANILSPPTIGDIDGDGYPEILSAGGNELRAYNHDGTMLWSANVIDESGATAASIFDFEGDGIPDVVYIDEVKMYAFDGPTGGIKFSNDKHASGTMFDYPVVADVDGDDQAEILVCHNGFDTAFSVYGDQDESWMPSRSVWNQYAYHINNINDDLSIPTNPVTSFEHSNTWHSGVMTTAGEINRSNVEVEIVDVCTDECDDGLLWLTVRLKNTGESVVPTGTTMSIYGVNVSEETWVATLTIADSIEPNWTSDSFQVGVFTADIVDATAIKVRADDDGTGTGLIQECSEGDNDIQSDEMCP